MKKNVILIMLAAVALLAACQKKVLSERESLDRRTVSTLEVQYALDGKEVQTLNFSHEYTLCELTVTVNNDGLIWNLKSDSPWCKVLPGEHRGSGKVTLELAANDRFVDRMDAILTFVAGDFQGFRIPVVQSAATFIVGQPYFVADLDGGVYTVDVKTLTEKKDWTYESLDDWLSAEVVNEGAPDQGMVTKRLSLTAAANGNDSRLGTVKLSYGGETDELTLWQFGTDLSYDAGKIYFPSDSPAQLQFLAPRNVIKGANLPDYASQNVEQVAQNREKWTISFADNLSDCEERRDIDVSITLSNNTSSVVPFPQAVQDYTPAYGLMTAKGVQRFTQKVNAGESTADWERDGWVKMLNDIDMTGVTGWTGIGTTTHPFSGKFDGNGHSILNLKQSKSGFFNICEGESESNAAIIQNLTMGKSCTFVNEVESNVSFGGVVNHAASARIYECSNLGQITFGGASIGAAFLGGIVGWGWDAVTIRGCHMEGTMTVVCEAETAQIGGIAGYAPTIRNCDFAGSIVTQNASLTTLLAGGITSMVAPTSSVYGNAFSGSIEANSANVYSHYLGGLYASVAGGVTLNFDKANDMSSVSGSIKVNGYKGDTDTEIYVGGFIGYVDGGSALSFKGYDVQTKIFIDQSVNRTAGRVCAGGVLGGSSYVTKLASAVFEDITPQGELTFNFASGVASGIAKGFYGGVAGFIYGPATFKNCRNKSSVGTTVEGSNVNAGGKNDNSVNFVGGVAAYVEGGNASFTGCRNEATVMNLFYCNQSAYDNAAGNYLQHFHGVICGGVLGGFDMHKTMGAETLTVSDCHGTATVDAIRGFVGGIVGYAQNATISGCSYTGKETSTLGNQIGCHQGGIIGGAAKTEITSCTAKTNIHAGSPGSSDSASPGGILGRAIPTGPVTLTSCRYYGTVTAVPSNGTTLYPGGLVGCGTDETTVSNCLYGGAISKTNKAGTSEASRDDINSLNVLQFVFGNGLGTQTDTRLWDGH